MQTDGLEFKFFGTGMYILIATSLEKQFCLMIRKGNVVVKVDLYLLSAVKLLSMVHHGYLSSSITSVWM